MSAIAICIICNNEFDWSTVKTCPKDGVPLAPIASSAMTGAPQQSQSQTGLSHIGQTLEDRYRIIDLIGVGKTGNVYKAEQIKFNRVVAVKMMHSHLVNSDVALARFQREAQAISKLRHKNLLSMIDFGVTKDQQPYMVTEFLDGITLESLVENEKRLHCTRALPIFIAICDGLNLAHDVQIIHRDIKPGNIVLVTDKDGKETPKVIDFGLVKFLDESGQSQQLTQIGQITGTPAYMSPEQVIGQTLDARTDIYSLGCVLYFALTGRPPFIGDNIADLLSRQMKELPPAFSVAAPKSEIPQAIERVVFKAIAKQRENRFQNVKEFQSALQAAFDSVSLLEESVPQTTEVLQPVAAAVQSQEISIPPESRAKKQQYVMHDAEKGSKQLVAKDHHQRVDKNNDVFTKMRKRQSEDLSEKILKSVKSSFVGEQTMSWLQNVSENVSGEIEPNDRQPCQLSMAALMDKLFDDFQRYSYQFNQTEESREFVISCVRPSLNSEQGKGSAYQGHLQNSIWGLRIIGDSKSIRMFFVPAQRLYHEVSMSQIYFLELTVRSSSDGPSWFIGNKPIYLSQISFLSKKIFARLMRVSRGEVSENDLLEIDVTPEFVSQETEVDQVSSVSRQDPADTITYSLLSIFDAIDAQLAAFQQEGVVALKHGGVDALTPIMLRTKQYDAFREKAAVLAKEWAGMLSS